MEWSTRDLNGILLEKRRRGGEDRYPLSWHVTSSYCEGIMGKVPKVLAGAERKDKRRDSQAAGTRSKEGHS